MIARFYGVLRPTKDPEIESLREKVKKARKALDDRLDKDSGTREVARAMLQAIKEENRA